LTATLNLTMTQSATWPILRAESLMLELYVLVLSFIVLVQYKLQKDKDRAPVILHVKLLILMSIE